MSTEENKAIVLRLFKEGMNGWNPAVFHELIATNYVNHNFPAPAPGPDGFLQVMGMFHTAFPDMHITTEDVIAEADKVATRGYFTGTHRGEFMEVPPTGKQIKISYADAFRVENGKLVENWVQMDMMGMMQQLGVIPEPGQTRA